MIARIYTGLLLTCIFSISSIYVYANNYDSLRLEYIDGKAYVIHKVDPSETLFSIAKRYNASMNAIAEVSPEVKGGLHDGMIIKVPYNPDAKPIHASPPQPKEILHTVKQGETLYSISRIYEVSVIDIMEWNNLLSTTLEIGQNLKIEGKAIPAKTDFERDGKKYHIVQAGEGLFAVARIYDVSIDSLVAWNKLGSSALNLGQELIVGRVGETTTEVSIPAPTPEPPKPDITEIPDEDEPEEEIEMQPEPNAETDPVKDDLPDLERGDMIKKSENGLAAVIEGENENDTYLAMHREIPAGTLVAVRNEMNNQVVFVRIAGKLPDTGINEKIIIRLSGSAVRQLRAIDPKFRVEISYLEPESGF